MSETMTYKTYLLTFPATVLIMLLRTKVNMFRCVTNIRANGNIEIKKKR